MPLPPGLSTTPTPESESVRQFEKAPAEAGVTAEFHSYAGGSPEACIILFILLLLICYNREDGQRFVAIMIGKEAMQMRRATHVMLAVLLLVAVASVGAYAASFSLGIGIGGRHGGASIVVGNTPYVSPYAYAYPTYGRYYYPAYGYYYPHAYARPYYTRPAASLFFSIPFGSHAGWGQRGWHR